MTITARAIRQRLFPSPVLSLKRQYAEQIVTPRRGFPTLPQKWIENRTWCDDAGLGPILIHASGPGGGIIGAVSCLGMLTTFGRETEDCFQTVQRLRRQARSIYRGNNVRLPGRLDWSYADNPCDFDGPLYWWLLAHPVKFSRQITCKGQLRLWEPSPDILREVNKQLH